jgi:tRNA A37 threonylcarbamoyltransferase TsaD
MKEKVFDPIIERVEALLDRQILKMKDGDKIDSILMVGGFSQSKYLQDRLKIRYEQPDIIFIFLRMLLLLSLMVPFCTVKILLR